MLVALAFLLLAGCDEQGRLTEEPGLDKLEAGVSREADVRLVMGQPDAVIEEDDGMRVLQYPGGPEGVRTWSFRVDAQGVLRGYEQVLTADNFARIRPGMTRNEVVRMLGRPRGIELYPRRNEEIWHWKYLQDHTPHLFNVHFNMVSNEVMSTSTSMLSPEAPAQ